MVAQIIGSKEVSWQDRTGRIAGRASSSTREFGGGQIKCPFHSIELSETAASALLSGLISEGYIEREKADTEQSRHGAGRRRESR
jgi:hypothetical protein